MKNILNWLENSFSPKMNKFAENPWVSGISNSMMKILPFILVGSLIFFYNVFRTYLPQLPDLSIVLMFTFQMISLILVFMVAKELMDSLKHPQFQINAGITAILAFIMSCSPTLKEGMLTVDFARLGPSGMFVAIVIGVFVAVVYHLFAKLHFLENNKAIPEFIIDWINHIIPILIVILSCMIVIDMCQIDIYNAILQLFMPIQNFGFTLPGFILICLVPAFLYSLGISTWFVGAVTTPILMAGTAANIAAVAAGEMPTQIVCYETIYALSLISLGGSGGTLPLNIMLMFSKSKKLKTLGKVCLGPSIVNINEPIAFGVPVVFNPLLMLPMWINSITGPVIIWFAMKWHLLTIPGAAMAAGQVPAPFGYIIITGDFRALIFYVLIFALYYFTWLPFFKVYEKNVLKEELAQN